MIDVNHQINAVARAGRHRMFEAGEARSVVIAQTYDTTVEDLWDAVTNGRAHPPLVPAGVGRPAAGRHLPAGGQRRRGHHRV